MNQIATTDTKKLSDLLSINSEIHTHSATGFSPEYLGSDLTYIEAGVWKLSALARSLGMEDKIPQMIEIFRGMTKSWGDRKVGEHSGYKSDVSDDFAPFEFSIAFENEYTELRVLLEAQGWEGNVQSNWQAGLEVNQYLAEKFNVNLDRFDLIKDLFVPTNLEAKLAMWHAVCFYPDREPKFKLYLNPQAQGTTKAAAVVEESLVRLGFDRAWLGLAEVAAQRGNELDQFTYFSLDLCAAPQARVKIYFRHHHATAKDLETALSLAQNYVDGDVTEFCQALSETPASFMSKPIGSCFGFVAGDEERPLNGTIYLPVGYYAANDRTIRDRLDTYLNQKQISIPMYHSVLEGLATRRLEAGVGMHSYISLRREGQQPRIAVYLNPEVNMVRSPATALATQPSHSLPSLEEMVSHYESESIADHPFFQRMEREPINKGHLWLLLMNIRETSTHFTRRLIDIIARVDDNRIRSILVKQLNDELGNGDIKAIHIDLYEQLMAGIESWRIESFTEEMTILGTEISQRLEEIYSDPDPYVGVGASLVSEIYAKQFDFWLADRLRETGIERSVVAWASVHEELEVLHAAESLDLAHFVSESEERIAAARKGIDLCCIALVKFLNGLYRLCYG
jgi:DMATS type aromatic prenyltransferase